MTDNLDYSSFLYGGNAVFIAELYTAFMKDPNTVDPSWVKFFTELQDDALSIASDFKYSKAGISPAQVIGTIDQQKPKAKPVVGAEASTSAIIDSLRALMLIRVYRVRGHLIADLDPLNITHHELHPELNYKSYGFTEDDLDRPIFIDNVLGLEKATLRQILEIVQTTYCGAIGVEFMHIQDPAQKAWIQERIETARPALSNSDRLSILERLIACEGFEKFLQLKYTGTKRFGLEGGESLLAALEQILKRASEIGVRELSVGMPHRGRLNVLANFMKKPYKAIFSEFQGNPANPSDVQGSGDVKYHLGTSSDREINGQKIHLSLQANPSHLEIVNPVVEGKVRAKQTMAGDKEHATIMAVLMHGDAAFAGQGVVPETMLLSQLKGYSTGGTIHIIVNNQIGFTTAPQYSRSGPYSSDIAKAVQAPIFHVNGDSPESVDHVAKLAIEFRQAFKTDVVIDMICYRRHGHNETDEPAFTQPLMYKTISVRPTTQELYAKKLINEGVATEAGVDSMIARFMDSMEAEFNAAKSYKVNKADYLEGLWQGFTPLTEEEEFAEYRTGVQADTLSKVGMALSQVPKDFDINPKLVRQLDAKAKMIKTGAGIDWATAEALAFGSLLSEGKPVRISGQDVKRGTFSQRHAVLIDQTNENYYIPLAHISPDQAKFEVIDSPLSEEAVLGFEYGYSLAQPDGLTIWEAQFGDFANGAQVVIDQFISSGESKWLRMSGLVMLLPHGYEGQGPEHSSARLERYLQSSAEDNWSVCNLTTPANYYHALRRQLHRNFRKPLIIMTPKSLLRHKLAVSSLADMQGETKFKRILADTSSLVADKEIKRVILCSGKIYYDLFEERQRQNCQNVAIIRIEQLYPWPKDSIKAQLARYPNAEICWAQEEPANMGAWVFVDRRLEFIIQELNGTAKQAVYCGRHAAASPATGSYKTHNEEQAWICQTAISGDLKAYKQPFQRVSKLSKLHI